MIVMKKLQKKMYVMMIHCVVFVQNVVLDIVMNVSEGMLVIDTRMEEYLNAIDV